MTHRRIQPPASAEPRHPIQVVSRRTGLTPDALRAWEKRYQAVTPRRAAGGRRLYSDDDVERLLLLRRATEAGRRIGQIAPMSTADLRSLVAQDQEAEARGRAAAGGPGPSLDPSVHLAACLGAVEALDGQRLELELRRAQLELSVPTLLAKVIAPLMEELGQRWHDGRLRPAQEHLATTLVRSLLGLHATLIPPGGRAPTAVVTTPSGQIHEVGALMAAVTAGALGWRILYLGPDLPAEEIADAARRTGARAVALSIVHPADDPRLPGELQRLRRLLGDDVAIIVGGRAAASYEGVLREIRAERPSGLADLRRQLDSLG